MAQQDNSPMGLAQEVEQLMQMPQSLCKQRGICCRVAVFKGLHSVAGLHEIAKQADEEGEMARDFASIFIPYATHNEVRAVANEFVDRTLARAEQKGMDPNDVGFYHCKYVLEDGRCGVHEDRPIGCRKYPLPHPQTLFHPGCGYEHQARANWERIYEILDMLGIADQYT